MLCEDVERYIEEIRQQLHHGHASLMVGAGFSLNAEKASINTPLPPTWLELQQAFVDGLYKTFDKQYQKKMSDTKTVLQLAQEYDTQFGRSSINALIKELIKDDELLPGELHKAILQLPWRDIFTTNYDTLLERASKQIIDRKYTPVYCCDDLAHSETPRIIKLHGSIQTNATRMILTEEDYRLYPNLYAPFVNTVQQAITETTLCLIGFSGTDPNFLKWIGWVRDNLKDSMRFIYLIGKLNISEAEYQVLIHYKIKPVDLSILGKNKNQGYKELLSDFISRLQSQSAIEWDLFNGDNYLSPSEFEMNSEDSKKQSLRILSEKWREQREKYPKWLITPYKYREILIRYTEYWHKIPKLCLDLSAPDDIQLLFEYNWRREHCLMPLPQEAIEHYETILRRNNPLKIDNKDYFSADVIIYIDNGIDHVNLCEMWIQLMFAVMRYKREEGNINDFEKYETIISTILENYPEYSERFYYEKAIFALSLPDIELFSKIMEEWKKHLSIPEWKIKYASLIAEFGKAEEAMKIFKEVLPLIRQSISQDYVKNDFYCLSLEGVVLTALISYETGEELNRKLDDYNKNKGNINNANETSADSLNNKLKKHYYKSNNIDIDEKSDLFDNSSSNLKDIYRQRLSILKAYHCDPNEELTIFKLSVVPSFQECSREIKTRSFEKTTYSYQVINSWNKNVIVGYQFLRYLEVTGIPLRFNNITFIDKTMIEATRHIAKSSPRLAFSYFIRAETIKKSDYELFFSQCAVYNISKDEIDKLLLYYVKSEEWIIHNSIEKVNDLNESFYNNIFKKLLEVISRLIVKASPEKQEEVFELILKIYNFDINYTYVKPSFENCVKNLLASIPVGILSKKIDKLLQINPPKNDGETHFWVNPFDYIDTKNRVEVIINNSITLAVDVWFSRLNTDSLWLRKISLQILFVVADLGILTENQREAFVKEFFKEIDDDGLPINTDFYPWVFLKVARFSNTIKNIEEKLLNHYKNYQFDLNEKYSWMYIYDFNMNCYSMLLNLSKIREDKEYKLDFSEDDAILLLPKISMSMNEIGEKIVNNQSLKFGKVNNKLFIYDRILAEIIIPRIINIPDQIERVTNLLQANKIYQPFPSSEVALQQNEKQFSNELEQAFILTISSGDLDYFNLYSWAIVNSYIYAYKNMGPKVPSSIFLCLLSALGMRTDNIFSSICETIIAILDFYEMNQQESDLMLKYLEQLETETQFSCKNSRFSYESRYDYRISACGLAARVYQKYSDESVTMPLALQQWNEIAHSTNEFPSLRNKWEEIINHRN